MRIGLDSKWLLMLVFAVLPVRAEEVVVSAAASLTNAFKEVGTAFEKGQAAAKVTFNFAASGPLLQQIENGAPVDVFVSADQETMNAAEKKQLTIPATRRNLVSHQLVLVQPKAGSPLKGIGDLANDTVRRIAIGNRASAPVGRYIVVRLTSGLASIIPASVHYSDTDSR